MKIMNTLTRKLNLVAKTVATGLLVTLAMGAHAADRSATASTVAWIGQMEVTAPSEVANLGHMEVTATVPTRIADLGSMTVTAVRETAVAQRTESTGETDPARSRSPRAVLVQ
jgi:hypothetical protein